MKAIIPVILLLFVSGGVFGQNISVSAGLDSDEIWLGDSVQLTIYLQGSEQAITPKLYIPDVRTDPLGGTVRSSRSVTNINGKVTETVRKAYVYGFRLTPAKSGNITIPPIEIEAEGKKLATNELTFQVRQPRTSEDFSLELQFDREQVFLNEECFLKISFLYGKSLRSLQINIPGLDGLDYDALPAAAGRDQYEININGEPIVFGSESRGGRSGLSAVLSLKPDTEGTFRLENSTASFESVTGYEQVQDFFGRIHQQEAYGRTVIPGNSAVIRVNDFPAGGKPDGFFGLSGDISLELLLEPRDVHIGDPLTLSLMIHGMNNTDIRIPPLAGYLGDGIDIPDTRSSAKVSGNTKTITQTIRIKDSSVNKIPPIRFSYFNTDTEKYEYAETIAIPINVLETQIVTSGELEGGTSGQAEKKVKLESRRDGIYFNYTGDDLLRPGLIMTDIISGSLLIKIILLLPPAVFLVITLVTRLLPQLRERAAERADRSRAVRKLRRSMGRTKSGDVNEFLREFNRDLTGFLKIHGTAEDSAKLKNTFESINGVLYGQQQLIFNDAAELVDEALKILESGEARK